MSGRAVRRDEAFGRRLVEAMMRAGVKPADLARALGVLPGTVSRWRRGECPDDLRFPLLSSVLGVDLAWLKTGVADPTPEANSPGALARQRARAARLAFLRDSMKAYVDLGQLPSLTILEEWMRLAAADLDPDGEPEG